MVTDMEMVTAMVTVTVTDTVMVMVMVMVIAMDPIQVMAPMAMKLKNTRNHSGNELSDYNMKATRKSSFFYKGR